MELASRLCFLRWHGFDLSIEYGTSLLNVIYDLADIPVLLLLLLACGSLIILG